VTELPPSFAPVGFAWETLKEHGINRLRIAGAEELLGAGGALIDATGRSSLTGARFLLTAQATRAQHTFETLIAAARMGRGVQAAMLNRALLDDVLDIHWTAANPDEAPERADQHDRMIALAEHDFEDKFNRADRPLSGEEREELAGLIKLYGGGGRAFNAPWHRTSFEDCFALMKDRWSDEPDAAWYLNYIYEVIQRRNNLLLHGSPTGYRQTVVVDPAGKVHLNRTGPDRLWPESLAQGAGGYYFVCRVLAEEFAFDKEPMAEVFSRATAYCRKVEDLQELAALPDDAPCPCTSGGTVSDCHRS
jgi:hypothetical protein